MTRLISTRAGGEEGRAKTPVVFTASVFGVNSSGGREGGGERSRYVRPCQLIPGQLKYTSAIKEVAPSSSTVSERNISNI